MDQSRPLSNHKKLIFLEDPSILVLLAVTHTQIFFQNRIDFGMKIPFWDENPSLKCSYKIYINVLKSRTRVFSDVCPT